MNFVSYWDRDRILRYFDVLLKRGLIEDSGKKYGSKTLYRITNQVNDIVREIEESYNKELYTFINKYNIEV